MGWDWNFFNATIILFFSYIMSFMWKRSVQNLSCLFLHRMIEIDLLKKMEMKKYGSKFYVRGDINVNALSHYTASLIHCCFNVGASSKMLSQNKNNIVSCLLGTAYTVTYTDVWRKFSRTMANVWNVCHHKLAVHFKQNIGPCKYFEQKYLTYELHISMINIRYLQASYSINIHAAHCVHILSILN